MFQKAEYLVNWKKESQKLIQEKKGKHFLEYLKNKLTKTLKDNKVLDQESVLDLEV